MLFGPFDINFPFAYLTAVANDTPTAAAICRRVQPPAASLRIVSRMENGNGVPRRAMLFLRLDWKQLERLKIVLANNTNRTEHLSGGVSNAIAVLAGSVKHLPAVAGYPDRDSLPIKEVCRNSGKWFIVVASRKEYRDDCH